MTEIKGLAATRILSLSTTDHGGRASQLHPKAEYWDSTPGVAAGLPRHRTPGAGFHSIGHPHKVGERACAHLAHCGAVMDLTVTTLSPRSPATCLLSLPAVTNNITCCSRGDNVGESRHDVDPPIFVYATRGRRPSPSRPNTGNKPATAAEIRRLRGMGGAHACTLQGGRQEAGIVAEAAALVSIARFVGMSRYGPPFLSQGWRSVQEAVHTAFPQAACA